MPGSRDETPASKQGIVRSALDIQSARLGSSGQFRDEDVQLQDHELAPEDLLEKRKQDLLDKIESEKERSESLMTGGRQRPAGSARLQSQLLASQEAAPSLEGLSFGIPETTTGFTGKDPYTGAISHKRHYTLPPRGDAREPDYSYTYRGTPRFSVGEQEYGNQPSYQGLPYYRRRQ
jgi:hypothetical protein